MSGETFSEYVRRVMKQKDLKAVDVERNSGGKIDRSHVSKMLGGVEKNPSAMTMMALAKGLKVDPHDVFTAVTGCPPGGGKASELNVMELLSLVERIAAQPELLEALRGLVRLPEKGRVAFLNMLRLSAEEELAAKVKKPVTKKRR
jgi:hypothetical protein